MKWHPLENERTERSIKESYLKNMIEDKKHVYTIIGLLLIVILLLVWVIKLETRSARELIKDTQDNVAKCSQDITAWKTKYPQGTAVDDAGRSELSAIIEGCQSAIGNPVQ